MTDIKAADPTLGARASSSQAQRAAWDHYHQTFDDLRVAIEQTPRFEQPDNQARAYTLLMEAQAFAYNFAIAPRLLNPRIFVNTVWQTDVYTLGTNGPDFHYAMSFLDGAQTYRLTGNLGDTLMFLAQSSSRLWGDPDAKLLGNHDFKDFEVDTDGNFEVIVSATEHPGNWIRLDPTSGYNWLQFRRATGGWGQSSGTLAIERIGDLPDDHYDADEFDDAAIATRIIRAAEFARYIITEWAIGLHDRYVEAAGDWNNFARFPGVAVDPHGSQTADYVLGTFQVDDDEALIVTLAEAPQGVYWSYPLADVWSRTLDFRERQSTLNFAQVRQDADGAIRVVISRRDPGVANWLDTTGRREGDIAFRNYRTRTPIVPTIKRLKLNSLWDHLPADTARVTPEERSAELKRRRRDYLARHGE